MFYLGGVDGYELATKKISVFSISEKGMLNEPTGHDRGSRKSPRDVVKE